MTGSRIAGLGIALPLENRDNSELSARLDLPEGWIESRTGIDTRRVAAEHETTTTLGTAAALAAIGDADIAVHDIDLVICATVTPDHRFPATACMIQAALGIAAPAFDLNAGCSGFLFGLAQADAAVRTGWAKNAIVVGAEVLSRITDPRDRKTAILFGDGAGAAVVTRADTAEIGPIHLFSDGSRPELLYVPNDTGMIHMEGREVYRAAVDAMVSSVSGLLSEGGLSRDDVDLLIAHQANQRILDAVVARLGLASSVAFSNISRYGNTSAASIPIALFEARETGALSEGDLCVLTAFGAGFTWGAAAVRWTSTPRVPKAAQLKEAADA